MAQPLLGQVLTFAGTFAPAGYMLCAGQSLPIDQYDALYTLLGTTYGGDGVQTFNLPDLRSRVPVHMGVGPGLTPYVIGQFSGVESVTLSAAQMPTHTHPVAVAHTLGGNASVPSSSAVISDANQGQAAAYPYTPYASANAVTLAPASVSVAGSSLAHDNRQPYLALNYCIAITGVYPQRS